MNEVEYSKVAGTGIRKVQKVSMTFHRYLYSQINWNNRLIGIKGARGVGKSTLLMQHIREAFVNQYEKVLYVSLDNLWFETHDVIDLVEYHYQHGGTHVFFDEVHHNRKWHQIMKQLYDDYEDLFIVFTGSSMLDIDHHEADLSRRVMMYTLEAMSFREFLQFEGYDVGDAIDLDDLLQNHLNYALHLTSKMKILPLFEQYLKYGYYPFYKKEADGFEERLERVIHRVLDVDVPLVEDVNFSTIDKMQRMLMILAERVPFEPKMAELYRELETTRDQGLKMLYALTRADLLQLLGVEIRNLRSLSKPDKIYLSNTNLMYCLSPYVDKGTLRETFFMSQLRVIANIGMSKRGDFCINKQYMFEVGGKSKNFDQIKDEPNSFLAVDDTEIGHFNRIPLWMFGMLY